MTKKNKDKNIRTLSLQYKFTKDELSILRCMSSDSRRIFNSVLFYEKIYYIFKSDIYRNVINKIKFKNKSNIDNEKIYSYILIEYDKYYKFFINNKEIIKENNIVIYNYMKSTINFNDVTNNTYESYREKLIKYFKKNKLIKYDETNENYVYINVIDRILRSFYNKNYFYVKNCLLNHKPYKNIDDIFVKQVKNEQYILKEKKDNFKSKLAEKYDIKGDQVIIKRYVYSKLDDVKTRLNGDIVCNIINKALTTLSAYYELRKVQKNCKRPKFIDKNGYFILPFFDRSKKYIESDKLLRITLGRYISNNYNKITKNEFIQLNNEQKKKYVDKKYLAKNKDKIDKKTNYTFNNMHISKNHKKIIDSNYMYLKVPTKLNYNNINLVEISPVYGGIFFNVNIVYKIDKIEESEIIELKDMISIDLGMKNLMTIYDPIGKQYIISGLKIISLNKYYNRILDNLKSKYSKTKKESIIQTYVKMLRKRRNKIEEHFNNIIKWIENKYNNKKEIVIGYNEMWKNKVNIGKKNNRKFYEIPYRRLINKLRDKLEKTGKTLKTREESYTSKCDALALEDVCKHENYKGRRVKRGLFESSTGRKINADLNGAINIIRKYCKDKEIRYKKVEGERLYNPIKVNCDVESNSTNS